MSDALPDRLSADPASPHYRDLAPLWAEGRYFPLLYSRGAIEKAAESRLVLRPSPARAASRAPAAHRVDGDGAGR